MRVSRQLGLLRPHRRIRKVSGTYRYERTETGQKALAARRTVLRSARREWIPEAA